MIYASVTFHYQSIPVADIEVMVYPMRDDAFPAGHADDVYVLDIYGHWQPVPSQPILDVIQAQQPLVFDQIVEERDANQKASKTARRA